MMENVLFLKKMSPNVLGEIQIGGSKSESNRLLIINHLFNNKIQIENLSDSEDTFLLQKALKADSSKIDIHHAGTAMRFLTAFYSAIEGKEIILTGSERMKQRPLGILVNALRSLGAEIDYLENEGFPPLRIKGKILYSDFVKLDASISSQFITALMLIAPKLQNGLTIELNGKITSLPYLMMTLQLLNRIGIKAELDKNTVRIDSVTELPEQQITVESDWSSASYFYSVATLSQTAEIKLNSFFPESLQGDSGLVNIYRKYFGIETEFKENQLILKKKSKFKIQNLELDLNTMPDIAQTIAATCAGLKIKCKLTGLETLKIKETDRLAALKNELQKIGAISEITNDTLEIIDFEEIKSIPVIKTYNDHRMAMSFAPLSMKMDIKIENPEVVKKSYPDFWRDFEQLAQN